MGKEPFVIAITDEDWGKLKSGTPLFLRDIGAPDDLAHVAVAYSPPGAHEAIQRGEVPDDMRKVLQQVFGGTPQNNMLEVVRYDFEPECPTEAGILFITSNNLRRAHNQALRTVRDLSDEAVAIVGKDFDGLVYLDDVTDEQAKRLKVLQDQGAVATWLVKALRYIDETNQQENFVSAIMLTVVAPHRSKHRHKPG